MESSEADLIVHGGIPCTREEIIKEIPRYGKNRLLPMS
jgi:hypothetical protein